MFTYYMPSCDVQDTFVIASDDNQALQGLPYFGPEDPLALGDPPGAAQCPEFFATKSDVDRHVKRKHDIIPPPVGKAESRGQSYKTFMPLIYECS